METSTVGKRVVEEYVRLLSTSSSVSNSRNMHKLFNSVSERQILALRHLMRFFFC